MCNSRCFKGLNASLKIQVYIWHFSSFKRLTKGLIDSPTSDDKTFQLPVMTFRIQVYWPYCVSKIYSLIELKKSCTRNLRNYRPTDLQNSSKKCCGMIRYIVLITSYNKHFNFWEAYHLKSPVAKPRSSMVKSGCLCSASLTSSIEHNQVQNLYILGLETNCAY